MILDDSVTMKGNTIGTNQKVLTTDCIDRNAAGTCLCGYPVFICQLTKAIPSYAAGGSFSIMTCDTEGGTYEAVMTVRIPKGTLADGKVGKIAQLDMPPEGVKRYIKFQLDLDSAPTTGGSFDVIIAPNAARGL